MSDKADIKELAVAAWRLEKWLENLNADRKMAAKSALRSIKKYIAALGIEVNDPIGAKFDPGLAVEVINNEAEDVSEDELIIIETLTPYLYQNGELIQHARVIIGTKVKEERVSNEISSRPESEAPEDVTDVNLEEPSVDNPDNIPSEKPDDIQIGEDEIERIKAYAKIL